MGLIMTDENTAIGGVLATRKNLIEIVVLAVVLALAIELVSNGIIDIFTLPSSITITSGILLAIISIMYFVRSLFGRRKRMEFYDSFFIYDGQNNQVLPVYRHDLSCSMNRYLRAAFAENPALEKQWQDEPLSGIRDSKKTQEILKPRKSIQLVREVIEYSVLEYLSTHLTDYFNSPDIQKDKLTEYRREDIPEVLLTNRFLELFSRPMDDRLAFSDGEKPRGILHRGSLVLSSKGPYLYSRFDLVLPKRSKISRLESGAIMIKTNKVNLELNIDFRGFNTYIAADFLELYMGIPFSSSYDEYMVEISVKVTTKAMALLSRSSWEYYQWVDSFLHLLREKSSTESFLNKINWETAVTIHQINNMEKKAKKGNTK